MKFKTIDEHIKALEKEIEEMEKIKEMGLKREDRNLWDVIPDMREEMYN